METQATAFDNSRQNDRTWKTAFCDYWSWQQQEKRRWRHGEREMQLVNILSKNPATPKYVY